MQMNGCEVYVDDNGEIVYIDITIEDKGEILRESILRVGDHVLVDPLNPVVMKHRNRTGVIVGHDRDKIGTVDMIKIKFDDTKRVGKVDMFDLVIVQKSK